MIKNEYYRKLILIASAFLLIFFIAASVLSKNFDSTNLDLQTVGYKLFLYNSARLGLVFLLGIFFHSVGAAVLFGINKYFGLIYKYNLDYFIACSLLGASIVGVIIFIAGFCNLYYQSFIYFCIISAIFIFIWKKLYLGINENFSNFINMKLAPAKKIKFFILAFLMASSWLALIINKLIYIGEYDNDIWEHYLAYFHKSIELHSIWPNDIWMHFFVSKASGLFFAAILMGDIFSIQAVSMYAVTIIGLIIISLLTNERQGSTFGLCGAAILFSSWNSVFSESGSFLKHHTMIAFLMLGIVWCAIRVFNDKNLPKILYWCVGATTSFYLGLYLPVVSSLVCLSLLATFSLFGPVKKYRRNIYFILGIVFFGVAGTSLSLLVNYFITGLILDSPVNLMWKFINLEKFKSHWSPLAMEYWFLGTASAESHASTLMDLGRINFKWLFHLFRVDYFLFPYLILFSVILVALPKFTVSFSSSNSLNTGDKTNIIFIFGLIFGSFILSQPFQNSASIYRLYAFTIAINILLMLIIFRSLILHTVVLQKFSSWLIILLSYLICLNFLNQTSYDKWKSSLDFSIGRISILEVLKNTEEKFRGRITINDILTFRNSVTDKSGSILFLTYDPSPAYFLPFPPIKSEPSYSFGNEYREILYGDPATSKRILQQQDVSFIGFNLKNRLFLGIPYSNLLQESEIRKNFGLAWSEGDIYILGWKERGFNNEIPDRFFVALEAKKTGIIPDNARKLIGEDLTLKLQQSKLSYDQGSDYYQWLYEKFNKN
jgi:hypothetical protein